MLNLKTFAIAVIFLAIGGFAIARSQGVDPVAFTTAQFDTLKRGVTGGISTFLNDGVPLCDSDFATHLVRETVDNSALVSESPTHARSKDFADVVNVSLSDSRACRGTVVFTDGAKVAVSYTIAPHGFHNFLVKVSAAAPVKTAAVRGH